MKKFEDNNFSTRIFVKLLPLFILIILSGISQPAAALAIDDLFFIGDSLSDQGNCDLQPIVPDPPVTNGNTFTFYLAQLLGKTDIPSIQGGNNFACVGASTGYKSPIGVIKNGNDQVQQLLHDFPNFGKKSLFIYWLGSNDVLLAPPIFPLYPVFNANTSVSNVINAFNTLHSHGARYIVAINLPALERTPEAILNPANFNAYFNEPREFNQELINRLRTVGYQVIQIDLFSVFNFLLDNAAKFGFTDITHGCTSNPVPGQSCATSFFFNEVHPTDKAHRMLAEFIYSVLTGPDFFASLADTQLVQLQGQNALIRQQLYPQQFAQEIGKIYTFVGGTFTTNQPGIQPDRVDFDSKGGNGTIGVLTKLNENFLIGVALGHMVNSVDYDSFGSGFDNSATAISLFSSYQKSRFYINAILNYASLNFNNIKRNFLIGPVFESAGGDSSGSEQGASLQSGFNLIENERFTTGPVATLDYQHIAVNGYSESGNDQVFDLIYDDQSMRSFVGGLGWQATISNRISNIPLNTFVFLAINNEFGNDGDRDVYFHQKTLQVGFASLPVTQAAGVFATAGINLAAQFENGWIGSIGYLGSKGDSNAYSNLIMAALSIPL